MPENGGYSGKLDIPEGVKILINRGCQFKSKDFEKGIACGSINNLTGQQAEICYSCRNFYYQHQSPRYLGPYESDHAAFESF